MYLNVGRFALWLEWRDTPAPQYEHLVENGEHLIWWGRFHAIFTPRKK